MILVVDLAARFSAGMVMDRDGEIHCQFDSLGRSPLEFCDLIASTGTLFDVEAVIVEDVPYGISRQSMIKPVLRVQGRLISALERAGLIEKTRFLAPGTWQRAMGVWRAKPDATAAVATGLGYTPPDLNEIHASEIPAKGPERTKMKALLRKATTDYVDAFLIAKWSVQNLPLDTMSEIQGVQAA